MAVKFSRPAAKSHARNWTFQVIGGGNFLSSRLSSRLSSCLSSCLPVSLYSFIARVIRLAWSAVRWRRSRKTVSPPATARNATLMAKTPLRPIPELSDGGPAIMLDWAGTAPVCINDTSFEGLASLATAGAGADVAVIGGGVMAFVVVRGAAVILG